MTPQERVMTALHRGMPDKIPFFDSVDIKIKKSIIGKDEFSPIEFAEAFGMDALEYQEGFLPQLLVKTYNRSGIEFIGEGLLRTESDLLKIKLPDPKDESIYEDAKRFIDIYSDSGYALYTKTRLGASAVLNSMGMEHFSYSLADNPAMIEKALELYTQWSGRILEKLSRLGFDFVLCADDIAYKDSLMFSPEVFREMFLPKMKSAASMCAIPWIYHSDGNIMPVIEDLINLGPSGLHPMEPGPMDIEAVKGKYGHRICILGNIDLHYTLTRGTEAEVEAEVLSRITEIGKDGGYIICSANSIPSYCKTENIMTMIKSIKKYRGMYSTEYAKRNTCIKGG